MFYAIELDKDFKIIGCEIIFPLCDNCQNNEEQDI